MKKDDTYDQNLKPALIFNEVEHVQNNNSNNGCGLTTRDNALNRFKNTLKACAAASGLNRELIIQMNM